MQDKRGKVDIQPGLEQNHRKENTVQDKNLAFLRASQSGYLEVANRLQEIDVSQKAIDEALCRAAEYGRLDRATERAPEYGYLDIIERIQEVDVSQWSACEAFLSAKSHRNIAIVELLESL